MKKLALFAALAISVFGFAGAAQAQHYHGGGGHFYGGHNFGGHGYYPGNGWHGGRGGIDIIIGGGRGWYPNPYPYPYPAPYPAPVVSTRLIYETFYDGYGRPHTIAHTATWSYEYNGYVWYDVNGRLRVN